MAPAVFRIGMDRPILKVRLMIVVYWRPIKQELAGRCRKYFVNKIRV